MLGKEKDDTPASRLPKEATAAVAERRPSARNGGLKSPKAEATATAAVEASTRDAARVDVDPNPPKRRKRRGARGRKGTRSTSVADHPDGGGTAEGAKYPRHALEKALRIPKAILLQNAGRACSHTEAAAFAGVGFGGPTMVEISSALKYGLLERPSDGFVQPTDIARKILRPQRPSDTVDGLRAAIMKAPVLSAVYTHYRGENLPDRQFLHNTLRDTFHVPEDKIGEFESIFVESLRTAALIDEHEGKSRVLDFTHSDAVSTDNSKTLDRLGKEAAVKSTDTCFVLMPFGGTIGAYYAQIYEPAIRKAGLTAARADSDIFGTGKIIDQIWRGISQAKVLVTELTERNPNVFYELGLAHALDKPVVMVSGNEGDVPFDLRHIRVIYYDRTDPFWGQKLIDKVAENILSALANPEEALFKRALDGPQ